MVTKRIIIEIEQDPDNNKTRFSELSFGVVETRRKRGSASILFEKIENVVNYTIKED